MTWLIFKTFIKKSWLWLREHWQLPFLITWSVVIYVLTRRNTDALMEVVEAKKDSYKKQLEVLRKTHNDEILRRNKLIKDYEKTIKKVEDEFLKKEKELSEAQKNEIKEMIIKSKGSPDEVKEKIEKAFGIKFVE